MPPLVSEEADDFTEESLATSRAESPNKADLMTTQSGPSPSQSEPAQQLPPSDQQHEAQEEVEAVDDSDLIAQLQRSAQEADGDMEDDDDESSGDDQNGNDGASAGGTEAAATPADPEQPAEGGAANAGQTAITESGDIQAENVQDEGSSSAEDVASEDNEGAHHEEGKVGEEVEEEEEDGEEEDDDDDDDEEDADEDADEDDNEEQESDEDEDEDEDNEEEANNSDTSDQDDDEEEEQEKEVPTGDCVVCSKPITSGATTQAAPARCTSCDRFAHRTCIDTTDAAKSGDDLSQWHCSQCAQTATSEESPKSVLARARASNSAPRLVRDLLPVSRGVQKPNAHSIFEQPLISDGEDGGRALRKRRSPTQEPRPANKRRKKATATSDATTGDATPVDRAVAHSTRSALQPARTVPLARILQHRPFHKPPPHKFILAFRLGQEAISEILSKPPKPGRKARKQKQPKIPPPPVYQPPIPKFPALPSGNLLFPSLFSDRESDAKPYGGILSEQDADTSRSLPQHRDREIFEIARKEAEEERRRTSEAAEAEINGDYLASGKPNRTVSGPPSKIKCIQFGKFVIDTFYAAPYPEEYSHESRLFICEFCLKYLPSEFVAYRHKLKCPAKHPPGDEIYRDGSISIWEVDGRKKTEYCQCLCLMAKMFLGSKTLYYDVEPFLFYILTEHDESGYHFVGYFSKEKRPASQNNVSCILVMPIHQRKGYATFLIDFSYLLTRIEEKEGSPEKPLSDMGLTAYRAYWDLTISRHLLDLGMKPFSTKTLMGLTGMTADDVIHSLERLYAFTRDPVTKTFAIRYDKKLYETIVTDFDSKKHRRLRPERLVWTPYVMGRSDQAHLDGQPMATVAPREEDVEEAEDDDEDESQAAKSSKVPTEAVSPKTTPAPPSHTPTEQEAASGNVSEAIPPGPPSTDLLATSLPTTSDLPKVNGVVKSSEPPQDGELMSADGEALTGYALAFRTQNIPPMRFQITPPIPASMLRNRGTKKRTATAAFGRLNASGQKASLLSALATRSSPRTAGSSVNGRSSRGGSEKPTTPIRRSGRKSGLANVEMASLDGSNDKDEEDEETDAMEIEVAAPAGETSETSDDGEGDEEEDEEDQEESSSSAEEEDDEEEDDDDDQDKDPDAEPEEDDDSSSEDEEAGGSDEGAAEVAELADDDEDEDAPGEDDEDEDEDAPGEDDE